MENFFTNYRGFNYMKNHYKFEMLHMLKG